MAEIPKSVPMDIALVISDKTAMGMCKLLTDYLNEHWDKDIEVIMKEHANLNGTHDIEREVVLVEKE